MTDEEDRTRVVSPNTIPVNRGVASGDDDDDRTAVMSAAARAQALDAAALARAPLDFDLSGGADDAPSAAGTLDFDLTGGEDTAGNDVHGALDIDLGSGAVSLPEVGTAAAPAPESAAKPAVTAPAPAATSGGMGKWIAIAALVIAAVVIALTTLRK
ncbi:MAG: hypothetical protein IPG43_19915 [Proteobacteria bacterium]|nr:hypothetical protein [Pseudomonadota bacterium]